MNIELIERFIWILISLLKELKENKTKDFKEYIDKLEQFKDDNFLCFIASDIERKILYIENNIDLIRAYIDGVKNTLINIYNYKKYYENN